MEAALLSVLAHSLMERDVAAVEQQGRCRIQSQLLMFGFMISSAISNVIRACSCLLIFSCYLLNFKLRKNWRWLRRFVFLQNFIPVSKQVQSKEGINLNFMVF